MSVRNDTEDFAANPLLGLLMSTPEGIIGSESAGRSQLVSSAQMPADGSDQLPLIGVKVLGPTPGDPLFVDVELPAGWKKTAHPDDHRSIMLLDDKGRTRATGWYKAASYDRRADMHVCRRYQATYQPENGWSDAGLKDRRYVGIVTDCGNEIWRSDPMTAESAGCKLYEVSDHACKASAAWLTEHFPNYTDPAAYWD